MLLVPTFIAPSTIHGIGLFARDLILKDTPIWHFKPGFDSTIVASTLNQLSEPAREQVLKYSFWDTRRYRYILCTDDARFFNHASEPNCIERLSPDGSKCITVAEHDIQACEELTCNYYEFDGEAERKFGWIVN